RLAQIAPEQFGLLNAITTPSRPARRARNARGAIAGFNCHDHREASVSARDSRGVESNVKPQADASERLKLLRTMLLVRGLETAWGDAYLNEEIGGIPPSLSTGQEAVSVGACA